MESCEPPIRSPAKVYQLVRSSWNFVSLDFLDGRTIDVVERSYFPIKCCWAKEVDSFFFISPFSSSWFKENGLDKYQSGLGKNLVVKQKGRKEKEGVKQGDGGAWTGLSV